MPKRPGQPTSYDPEKYPRMAYVACKEGGFSMVKLAKLFGVCKATITNWKREHPEFLAAVNKGKDEFDTLNVENDLLKRARGFRYTETERRVNRETGKMEAVKKTTKLVIPDTTAQIFWLKNRHPERWRDKQEMGHTVDLAESTKEFLATVTNQGEDKIWKK